MDSGFGEHAHHLLGLGDLAGIREQRIALAERATSTRAAATTAREALEQARIQRDTAAPEIAEANAAWAAAKECGAQHAAAAREQQAAEQSADKAHTQLASAETTVGDAANAVRSPADDPSDWRRLELVAKQKISAAKTREELMALVARVQTKFDDGALPQPAVDRLLTAADERSKSLGKD